MVKRKSSRKHPLPVRKILDSKPRTD